MIGATKIKSPRRGGVFLCERCGIEREARRKDQTMCWDCQQVVKLGG